ncbi:MAG: DUF5615 family PIN-like protein [Actinomycetota bacterium]
MRLLFDGNLSYKLVERLADLYPDAVHVSQLDLQRAGDRTVFDHAAEHGFAIVSKDEDFHQLAFLYGPPPKVVWIRLGNCTTRAIESELRNSSDRLTEFETDVDAAFLVLGNRTA